MDVEEFMERVSKEPVAKAFGLVFCDPRRSGGEVIQVEGPRFMGAMPIEDLERCDRLMIVSPDVVEEVVLDLNAQAIEGLDGWWRFAIWS